MALRALLLLNHDSQKGSLAADEVKQALQRAGFELLEAAPQNSQTLSSVVLRHRDDVDLVIVAGGDGTLNSAADGLIETGLPLGIIPLGTANDLARTLQIPTELNEACRIIGQGRTRKVDVGRVNGKCFLNVASIGLSVDITNALTKDVKRTWGVLAYLKTAVAMALRAEPFSAEITADAQHFKVRTVQIAIGNGRHYGGGMTVAEDAAIDDHQLDFYSLETQHWWQLCSLMPGLRTGKLATSHYARTVSAKRFTVQTALPRSINTDGEITSSTPAEFEVLTAALTVFVPCV